jgi:hypothetical protein
MSMRIGIALALGIAIAAVDNLAFGGETSPIVIFGLLLVATGLIGLIWRSRGWSPRHHAAQYVLFNLEACGCHPGGCRCRHRMWSGGWRPQ